MFYNQETELRQLLSYVKFLNYHLKTNDHYWIKQVEIIKEGSEGTYAH